MEKMDTPKGMYSTKENPLPPPKKVSMGAGPGNNPDQKKVNRMMGEAYREKEYLRGKSGM